jgi:hypothetical protein
MNADERRELLSLRARVKQLREALEGRRMRRRQFEETESLIELIHTHMPGRAFYVADVLGETALRPALHATGVHTARQLGALLRDVRGHEVGGLLVRQVQRDRFGWVWAIERT